PMHDRVVLPAQPEIESQVWRCGPSVAEVQRVLELARRHYLVLDALVGLADLTEHEGRKGVVEVGRLAAAAQSGRVRVEIESTARVASLRLPVIEIQEIQEVSAAEVVLAVNLRDVGGQRVGPLVAENRVPAVAVAELAEETRGRPAEPELRISRISTRITSVRTRLFGARNSQDIAAEIPGVEVRSEHVLLLPGVSKRLVHQQRGRQGPRLAPRPLIHLGIPPAARDGRHAEIVRQAVDDDGHV